MVRAPLYYLDRVVPPSTRSTGTVSIEPVTDVDRNARGIVIKERDVDVRDGRSRSGGPAPTFDRFGFELREQPLGGADLLEHDEVVRTYLPQCEELVRDVVGGERVIAFGYNLRAAQTANRVPLNGNRQVKGPAQVVHADFTLDGSRQWVEDLGSDRLPEAARGLGLEGKLDPDTVQAMLDGSMPWKLVTVWRNRGVRPISDNSLAVCDGASVAVDDVTVCDIRYGNDGRVGEAYFARESDEHRGGGSPSSPATRRWSSSSGTTPGPSRARAACVRAAISGRPLPALVVQPPHAGDDRAPPREHRRATARPGLAQLARDRRPVGAGRRPDDHVRREPSSV